MSVSNVEALTEALWGNMVSPSTISDPNQKIFDRVETWHNRFLKQEYPYVFVIVSGSSEHGRQSRNGFRLGVDRVSQVGYHEVLGVSEASREDRESWRGFLRYLKDPGLEFIQLLVCDKSLGLLEALYEYYLDALGALHSPFLPECECTTHRGKIREASLILNAIHAQEDRESRRAEKRRR